MAERSQQITKGAHGRRMPMLSLRWAATDMKRNGLPRPGHNFVYYWLPEINTSQGLVPKVDILEAQQSASVHHILNRHVRHNTVHRENVVQSRRPARITYHLRNTAL